MHTFGRAQALTFAERAHKPRTQFVKGWRSSTSVVKFPPAACVDRVGVWVRYLVALLQAEGGARGTQLLLGLLVLVLVSDLLVVNVWILCRERLVLELVLDLWVPILGLLVPGVLVLGLLVPGVLVLGLLVPGVLRLGM